MVVLPVPFTPTTSTTAGRVGGADGVQGPVQVRLQRGDQLLGEQRAQLARSRVPSTWVRVRSRSTISLVGRDPDVGGEQRLLDLLPGLVVELVPGQHGQQAAAERVLRPGQPGPQPLHPAGGRLGDLQRRRLGFGSAGSGRPAPGGRVSRAAAGQRQRGRQAGRRRRDLVATPAQPAARHHQRDDQAGGDDDDG